MMPGDNKMPPLLEKASALREASLHIAVGAAPIVCDLLREKMRLMNAYYTNKIEGENISPLLIEQGMNSVFAEDPGEARRQRIAIAHIETEQYVDLGMEATDGANLYDPVFTRELHRHLYETLLPEDRIQRSEEADPAREIEVHPGCYRTVGVKVGRHIPPAPEALPEFMASWSNNYGVGRKGGWAIVGLFAAHHRLTWIHPFEDGNGRTVRLHTYAGLHAMELTQGIWSPTRGLARNTQAYYGKLIGADAARAGDLDGRGNLSEKGLVAFIDYMLDTCLDQVAFMKSMLKQEEFPIRLSMLLAAEGTGSGHEANLREPSILLPLRVLMYEKSMDRDHFKAMINVAPRTSDRILARLLEIGILSSATPRGPVSLAIPLRWWGYLFPRLWPEAEAPSG